MEIRKLRIFTIDRQKDHDIKMVHIFTTKYSKKIKKNEIHTPKSAKLIVENDQQLIQYTLLNPIIYSDQDGNVDLHVAHEWDKLIGKEEYFSDKETKISKKFNDLYHAKKNLGLSVSEMIEKDRYSAISDFEKMKKIKVPYIVGGGF